MARIISGKFGGYDEKSRPVILDGETTAAIEILLLQLIKTDNGSILFSLDCGEKKGNMRITKREGYFFLNSIETY